MLVDDNNNPYDLTDGEAVLTYWKGTTEVGCGRGYSNNNSHGIPAPRYHTTDERRV